MTDVGKIDTSREAVAKRLERLESLAERGWIDGDVVDLVSALSAERGQLSARLAACERERDEARVAMNAALQRVSYLSTSKLGFVEALDACQRGLELWRDKPYNAKWWRRIDGTPIPNDLLCNIAEILGQTANADRAQRDAALAELAQANQTLLRASEAIDFIGNTLLDFSGDDLGGIVGTAVMAAEEVRKLLPTPPKEK